ncbi:MAG: dihydroorotate dehydrogenase electron transfer subunit [Pirellulales bacterium]|nr:dihydroorotate dehydrogenase electron transfer subunit [Pirellulales bacterium]
MSDPLRQPTFADRACHARVEILENERLARDTYRVRFACPTIAQRIVPGQFVMLRLSPGDDPLLGRPLAFYDTIDGADSRPEALDVVYLVVGKMTSRLARCVPGQELEVWGPLGNGFPVREARHVIMVAGGIGQTPFVAVGREALGLRAYGAPARRVPRAERVTFCYGARTAEYFAGVDDFRRQGIDVRLSTDDGSAGHHGLVTEVLADVLSREQPADCRVLCCGPEKMMEAVAHLTAERGFRCELSLETPMACGLGICFSCVARVRDESGNWDYRRTCVEGPIFDAATIEF